MKVLHVVPTFYPATYWGGPIYSVYGLCNALAKLPDVSLRVLTTDSAGPKRSERVDVTDFPMLYVGGYKVFFCRRWWGHSFSPGMLFRLWSMIRWADVVHLTSVYSPPVIPTLLICRLFNKPVVWSPRGSLQRWEGATKPLLKGAWESLCNMLIKPGKCVLHITSEQEAAESQLRIPRASFKLVPNGVVFPDVLPQRVWMHNGILRLLFIGRLHQKKGIENLLQSLKALEDQSITLMICGSGDDDYALSLQELVNKLGLEKQVSFKGHVEGEEKVKVFMESDVCVVPSFTENFGMVVAEALAHGVPVIASKGMPWAEVVEQGCGLWVDNTPEALVEAIKSIRSMDLVVMGEKGRNWMATAYGWDTIGSSIFNIYKDLLGMKR